MIVCKYVVEHSQAYWKYLHKVYVLRLLYSR